MYNYDVTGYSDKVDVRCKDTYKMKNEKKT